MVVLCLGFKGVDLNLEMKTLGQIFDLCLSLTHFFHQPFEEGG